MSGEREMQGGDLDHSGRVRDPPLRDGALFSCDCFGATHLAKADYITPTLAQGLLRSAKLIIVIKDLFLLVRGNGQPDSSSIGHDFRGIRNAEAHGDPGCFE